MPIYLLEQSDENVIWGVWKAGEEDVLGEFYQSFISTYYFNAAITHAGKQLQKISSRMLIVALLKKWNLPFYGISRQDNCKPQLINFPYHISLSHTSDYSAAIIHKNNAVGIDIELVRPKLYTVAEKFLSDQELIDAGSNLNKLCVCWGVKEVVYKIYGLRNISLKKNIFIQPFDFLDEGGLCQVILLTNQAQRSYTIKYIKVGDHYLTVNV